MATQKLKKTDDLQNQFNKLEKRIRAALPKEIYTEFETITLKFTATPDMKEMPFSGSGLWKDGDVKEVDYLAGIGMMTRQRPSNFSQVGQPKKALFGIGNLLYQIPNLPVSKFLEAHRQFCDARLELESIIKSDAFTNQIVPSLAFCAYLPEKGDNLRGEASYNDWKHLRNEVVISLETINRLTDWLKKNAKRASSKGKASKSDSQSYAKRPATKEKYAEINRFIKEENEAQGKINSPRERFSQKAIFEKVAKKARVSSRTVRRAWSG